MNILSIQSHVSFGHVGNAAAVFPLQRLGFEVWPIHTVQFSNHTGYGAWRGEVFSGEMIRDLMVGMEERGALNDCTAVLTGYMGATVTGEVMLEAKRKVRSLNPDALYCCDPVMGDVGRGVFVQPDIPEFMRQQVLPHADILTPNQFELELLSGQAVNDLASAIKAAQSLRQKGPETVLVTSLRRPDAAPDSIECLAVNSLGAWLVATPLVQIDPAPNGSGDAIAALFLGHLLQTGEVPLAAARATSALYELFRLTAAAGTRELQLIRAQDSFVRPPQIFPAEKVG